MSGHRVLADLAGTGTFLSGRAAILVGAGAPDDTADVGLVYIRTDGSNGDEVIYTWDSTASTWDVMTA